MKPDPDMLITSLTNQYGGARMVAEKIGPLLAGCSLVVVPFAGGMSELPYIDAPKLIVCDRHRHLMNLARVMQDAKFGPRLYRVLRREVFHPDTLSHAQDICLGLEADDDGLFGAADGSDKRERSIHAAAAYAICCWMGRGGNSGTDTEFTGKLPVRFSPNGGGSAQRFKFWVASIPSWRRVLRRCEIVCGDGFEILSHCHDSGRVGIYCDPPWVSAGMKYRHPFTESDHRELSRVLSGFSRARVVIRYGDEPLIRSLYPAVGLGGKWQWMLNPSRSQANGEVDEVLIVTRNVKGGCE